MSVNQSKSIWRPLFLRVAALSPLLTGGRRKKVSTKKRVTCSNRNFLWLESPLLMFCLRPQKALYHLSPVAVWWWCTIENFVFTIKHLVHTWKLHCKLSYRSLFCELSNVILDNFFAQICISNKLCFWKLSWTTFGKFMHWVTTLSAFFFDFCANYSSGSLSFANDPTW